MRMYKYFSQFERAGYEGNDASLEVSLYEYGLMWKIKGDEIHFVYTVLGSYEADHKDYSFDHCTFNIDTDFWEEFDWIDAPDRASFLDYTGMFKDDFNNMSLEQKISSLLNYYGYENVFGTCYYQHKIGKAL